MVKARIRQVNLVTPDSIEYRKFCTERLLERQSFRPKLAPTPSNLISLLFEKAVRGWLGEQIPLLPKRILCFEEQRGPFGYKQKYREIDAISQYSSQPDCLFEIKTSFDPKSVIPKACKQLNTSLYITSHNWSNLRTCIIYVSTAPQNALEMLEFSFPYVKFSSTLESVQTSVAEEKIPCLVLSGIDVWQMAVRRGLCFSPSLWAEAQAEIAQNIHHRKEREALIALGIPREDWPASLTQQNRLQSAHQVAYFDKLGSETTLGTALQRALQKIKEAS